MDPAIEVVDLVRDYGKLRAVDHISFRVERGEVFGFLGPNGAGKTTTVRILTTLLDPTSGQVSIGGFDIRRRRYEARRQMGLVWEESNVYRELTTCDNLQFSARLYSVPARECARRAGDLLHTFNLHEKRDVEAQWLSKGMKRRLSIAMALIHRPSILFLDEPASGLDVQSSRLIKQIVREINSQGTTVFLTTHQMEEASLLCDRVAIINGGKIVALDSPERTKLAVRGVHLVEVAFERPELVSQHDLLRTAAAGEVAKAGDKWRIRTTDTAALLTELFQNAAAKGTRILTINTLEPTLEDAYLKLTEMEAGGNDTDEEGLGADGL